MAYHVSKTKFAELVEEALAELPEQFANFLDEVPVEIRPRSTSGLRKQAGVPRDGLLLGLYRGRALTQRSVEYSAGTPGDDFPFDVIYIFQEDIELASDSEEELVDQVRITVLHEIGHHFGLDEDDLDELGYG
jgi:predicted Zn-dependent protease with MMP-like domain